MGINFDSLPNNKPVTVIPKGRYLAKVEDAQMKTGKDTSKPDYLNLKYSLKTIDGKNVGTLFDIIAESEHSLMQYKLKRFLIATGITFTGSFELKDVQKIVIGKEFIVDTTIDVKENQPERSVVDVFTGEIYYNLSEVSDLFEGAPESIINASDALDANNAEEEF